MSHKTGIYQIIADDFERVQRIDEETFMYYYEKAKASVSVNSTGFSSNLLDVIAKMIIEDKDCNYVLCPSCDEFYSVFEMDEEQNCPECSTLSPCCGARISDT